MALGVQASRGCPYACEFCLVHNLFGKRQRYRDLDNVIEEIKNLLEDGRINPRDIKRELARTLVTMYHSEEDALNAEREFDNIFINKGIPDDIEEFKIGTHKEMNILDLIILVNFAPSKGGARRLVAQGGVTIDGDKITDLQSSVKLKKGTILKVGKRKFKKFV